MPYRNTPFVEDEYYHLYNRGVEKRTIFLDAEDYGHFFRLLYICNSSKSISLREVGRNFERGEPVVAIGLFCLMPNHFHLLAKQKIENGISAFMKKLLTAYSMYFNKKYKRSGHLFEGVFRSKHMSSGRQLKYLYAYIHLNPAKLIDSGWKEKRTKTKKELLDYVTKYSYSSMGEYLNSKNRAYGKDVLNLAEFPKYFNRPEDHVNELFDWLGFGE